MTEPINVTYSLETVLTRLESKIDRLDEKVDSLTVDMATVKTKLTAIEQQVTDNKQAIESNKKAIDKITEDVAGLKGFKALVIPLLVAVATAVLTTLGRFIPAP